MRGVKKKKIPDALKNYKANAEGFHNLKQRFLQVWKAVEVYTPRCFHPFTKRQEENREAEEKKKNVPKLKMIILTSLQFPGGSHSAVAIPLLLSKFHCR